MTRRVTSVGVGLLLVLASGLFLIAALAGKRARSQASAHKVIGEAPPGKATIIALPATSPRILVRAAAAGLASLEINHRPGWRIRTPESLPLATPAAAHGNLYFGGGYGSHEFYAVNASSGKSVWKLHTGDDGPTAAVCYEDAVLFNTESCTIYCVDARSGRVRWKQWLGDPLMNQPAAWEGKVYMAYPDGKGQHRLICMDVRNGKSLWGRPIDGDLISAPVIDDGVAYLATMSGQVCAFEARAGKPLWSKQYHATSAPWVHGRQVFVSLREAETGRRAGGPAAAPAESVATLGGMRGAVEQHQARRPGARYLTRAYNDQQANAKAFQLHDAYVGFASAPPAAHLAQAGENLGIATVGAGWAFQGSRPCLYQGRLYTSQDDLLRCTDARTGKLRWEARFTDTKRFQGGRALTPPALAGGAVYLATATGQILCLDAATGHVRWHVEVGEPISFQPAVMDGQLYVATDKGSVFKLDALNPNATGWSMWGGNAQHNGWTTPQ